jgi:hypothetical protein
MNMSIIVMLKAILVNLILFGLGETQCRYSSEYSLINYLACEINKNDLLEERLLSWKEWGFDSFSELPTKNKDSKEGLRTFDLDSPLTQKDKESIEQVLKSNSTCTIKLDELSCSDKLIKKKGFVPRKTIYSYSYPIQIKGTNKELYGIVLEQKTFELNSEIKLKVFVRQLDSWDLVYEKLLAIS